MYRPRFETGADPAPNIQSWGRSITPWNGLDNRLYPVIWNRSVAHRCKPPRLMERRRRPIPGLGGLWEQSQGDEQPWPAACPAPWIEQVIDLPGSDGKPVHRRSAAIRSQSPLGLLWEIGGRRLATGVNRPSACVRRRPGDFESLGRRAWRHDPMRNRRPRL
mgnify:CR=1 FL=1